MFDQGPVSQAGFFAARHSFYMACVVCLSFRFPFHLISVIRVPDVAVSSLPLQLLPAHGSPRAHGRLATSCFLLLRLIRSRSSRGPHGLIKINNSVGRLFGCHKVLTQTMDDADLPRSKSSEFQLRYLDMSTFCAKSPSCYRVAS